MIRFNLIVCLLIFSPFLVMFQQEESEIGLPGGNGQLLTLGLGLLFTAIAAAYVTQLAKVMSLLQFAKYFFLITYYV